jgi:hypothetical protein
LLEKNALAYFVVASMMQKKKVFNVGNRFYHRKEVEELGAKYVKLQCRGHGETPSQEQVSAWERT